VKRHERSRPFDAVEQSLSLENSDQNAFYSFRLAPNSWGRGGSGFQPVLRWFYRMTLSDVLTRLISAPASRAGATAVWIRGGGAGDWVGQAFRC